MLSRLFIVALVVAGLVVGGCSYRGQSYMGDGTMVVNPVASPRYDVEFEPLSLTAPGRVEYQLDQLPDEHMQAVLCLDDPTRERMDAIERAGVGVTMTLTDLDSGRTSVKRGRLLGGWATSAASWNGEKQEFEGVWFRPTRHGRYSLVLEVTLEKPMESPPTITATPHVRGGDRLRR